MSIEDRIKSIKDSVNLYERLVARGNVSTPAYHTNIVGQHCMTEMSLLAEEVKVLRDEVEKMRMNAMENSHYENHLTQIPSAFAREKNRTVF